MRNSDTTDVFVMRSDPEVMQYIPRPLAVKHADAAALIKMMNDFIEKGEKINWAITEKSSGKVIGMIFKFALRLLGGRYIFERLFKGKTLWIVYG